MPQAAHEPAGVLAHSSARVVDDRVIGMAALLEIDGRQGEGGGQVLRTSLAAALVMGQAVRVTNIRAGREEPGLKAQHLAAVKAAAAVGDAEIEGAALGSRDVTFRPKGVRGGAFEFDVGTAGSTGLVFQTVLPALLLAKEGSSITVRGGTHNPLAPPYEFLERAFLPAIGRLGARVGIKLDRPGLYPAGGGKVRIVVEPRTLAPAEILDRGEIVKRRAVAAVNELPTHIVERELKTIKHTLGWKQNELRAGDLTGARGPGNFVMLEVECEHVSGVFCGIGEKQKRAERVATEVCAAAKRWIEAHVPVDEYLADQLLLPMAVAGGGAFRTLGPLTLHATTQIALLQRVMGIRVTTVDEDGGAVLVRVSR